MNLMNILVTFIMGGGREGGGGGDIKPTVLVLELIISFYANNSTQTKKLFLVDFMLVLMFLRQLT